MYALKKVGSMLFSSYSLGEPDALRTTFCWVLLNVLVLALDTWLACKIKLLILSTSKSIFRLYLWGKIAYCDSRYLTYWSGVSRHNLYALLSTLVVNSTYVDISINFLHNFNTSFNKSTLLTLTKNVDLTIFSI